MVKSGCQLISWPQLETAGHNISSLKIQIIYKWYTELTRYIK